MGKHSAVALSVLTPERRKYIYAVLTMVMPILIAYGVLSGEQAALWLSLGGSVLGTGMATVFTIPKQDDQ